MMADEFAYPLLIKLEETNIPRLKIKLVKYFQSKKSNGGDCEVDYENGSRTAMLRFRREEDQRNVLAKESHQISLEKGVLKLTVHSLPEEKSSQETPSDNANKKYVSLTADVSVTNKLSSTDESSAAAKVQRESEGKEDDAADEDLCSTSALLGNIPNNLNQEVLEMLVENIVKTHDSTSSSQSFTLEVLPDISSAVVTFQSVKENTDFLARCPQNKMFTKKGLSVRPLEVTNQVLVDDIYNNSEEYLHPYFENEGGDVEDIILNEAEQSAVITFKDHQAFKKIVKKKHYMRKEEIRVYPFYKSLGRALYGKDKPSLKLPNTISEPIDSTVLRYLANKKSAEETICSEMENHFCNITLSQTDTVTLSPASSLLKQKDAKVLIREWSDTVKSAFAQSVSKFKSLKFHPDPEAWEESEKRLREKLLNEDVIVVPDKASGVLSVAGLVSDINRLEKSLSEIINETMKKVHREKMIRTQEIKVSPSIFHLLCQDGLEDKLLLVYPELKMSPDSPNLKITGLGDEIVAASKVIFDAVLALKRQNLETDDYVLELLKHEQQEELTDALLTSHQINAAFDISGNRVQLVAVSDRDLSNAQDHLTQMLISQFISVEDSNVPKKPEWQQLVSHLEQANSKPCRTQINTTAQQAVVSGYKDNVINVTNQLNDFLTQNAQIVETVTVKGDTKTGFLAQLVDGTDSVPKTLWHFQTTEGVEIAVCKADMCSYPVHAVISPSNQNLKHGTNPAAALLKADDHQLQDECEKINKKRGQLKAGDCVITDAGDQLCCKKVIHIVVPIFEKDKPQKALAQLKKAVKGSLELAESHGCISAALPSIGRDQGFPPKQCELTIVRAVKEYCDENYDDITFQKIHLVNTDDSALQDMVAAVREEFGNYGVTHSQQTPPKATQTSVLQPTGSYPPLCNEEAEELCSTSAVLGNIPDNTSQEFLEMLVESVKVHDSTSSSEGFILKVLPDISSAVVTFQSGKENNDFMKHCFQNKMFTKKGLSVRPLEVTNQVLVDDIYNNSEEYLHLYFENEGLDVEDIILNEMEQSAVITFKDHQAFKTIMKKKHYIKNEEIKVYPFYKSLGRALYGKDKPSLKLPAAISEPIDSAVLRYLADNKSAEETICSEMEKHFCNITLSQTDTVTLSPAASLLKQKDAKVLIREWSDTVKSAFAQSVSKFKSLKFHPDPEAWEESEKKLRETLLNEDVIVVPDKASGVLSVAGLVSDINRLEKSLSEIINKLVKKVHKETLSRTEEIKVSPSIFHLLCQDGLEDKLLLVYPELKMSPESPNLKITGLGEEIIAASKVIFDAVLALKRQNLDIDDYVLELLKHEQQEKLTDALLTSHQIKAAFNINGNRVQLVAVSDRDLYNAQDHLTQLLTSQFISVEDSNVLKKPEWQQLVSQLEQANSKPCRTRINTTAQQVVVSGYKDNVINVGHQAGAFLTQNTHIEETVVVKGGTTTESLAQLVDMTDSVPKTLYQLKTPEGVEIVVCKADMCSYPVHAVVSPANQDLKHNAGLAAALLKAAGPQLQDECDKIIKRGQLKPGDCIITDAGGQLCCQKVIHAIVPKFDKDKPQKTWAQLKRAVKGSLELAEMHGCVSVALPSIGRGLGFSLELCELIMVRAVKEYCDEKYDGITLQKIHLVNIDDIAVQDMVAAVRQEFGNHGVTHSQQTPAPNTPKPSLSQPTGSDSYLYHKKTKEGLNIILTKGNIEAATTEVVVNTISSDLHLNKGAVSKAILHAAGPKLQQLVDAQGASGNVGEVIVTDGCQLTSKKVFHAVTPHWDHGQGTAERTLREIFKDCLDMAEHKNLTSISLPAIGTGNLGFPKDLVASLILDKISEFSQKKNPKHLKKVVIVLYPGDKQTIQAFSDEFQKKFPRA